MPAIDAQALLAIALGPIVGSAAGSFARRWPDDVRGWLSGRSCCPACGHTLKLFELVPLASWLWLKGRCRHCDAPIAAYYPLVELAALLIALIAVLLVPFPRAWFAVLVGWWLLPMAVIDRRLNLLPDSLTLPLLLAGLAASWLVAEPRLPAPVDALTGAVAGAALIVLLRAAYALMRGREGIGLGDAKLLAAAGAWCGWQALPQIVLVGAGSALAVALLSRAYRTPDQPLPFGPWLALGFWCELLLRLTVA